MRARFFILTVLCGVILLGCKDKPVTPELPFHEMREGDLAFLKLLKEREDFFSLKLVYDNQDNLLETIIEG
jgi:hypothetical protein